MELNARKREILAAIIKTYMETGEPVGSKLLCGILGNRLSSATLRNEMSDLCALGYLEQPHTSAGRAPTKEGYRFYLKNLMPATPPDRKTVQQIDRLLDKIPTEPEHVLSAAADRLSDFTGLPAVAALLPSEEAKILTARILPTGREGRFLVVVMTSDGQHGVRMVETIWPPGAAEVERLNRILADSLIGRPVGVLTPLMQQHIIAADGNGLLFAPLLSAVFELALDLVRARCGGGGAARVYDYPELCSRARGLLELLSDSDRMTDLLAGSTAPVSVLFGEESGVDALRPAVLVIAGFRLGNARIGRMGVVGPTRMNYSYLVPSIEYFAKGLGTRLSSAWKTEA